MLFASTTYKYKKKSHMAMWKYRPYFYNLAQPGEIMFNLILECKN